MACVRKVLQAHRQHVAWNLYRFQKWHLADKTTASALNSCDIFGTLLLDAETFYKSRAASLITERREQLELTYKELARRLEGLGIEVDAKQLAKRINRGTLPFHLAMAIFEALEVPELKLPRLSRSLRR